MKRFCARTGCKNTVAPVKANRAYYPYCSPKCALLAQGSSKSAPTLALLPTQPAQAVSVRANVNRRHSTENRKASNE